MGYGDKVMIAYLISDVLANKTDILVLNDSRDAIMLLKGVKIAHHETISDDHPVAVGEIVNRFVELANTDEMVNVGD